MYELEIQKPTRYPSTDMSPLRKRLYRHQFGRCWICCEPLNEDITVDHLVPLSKGGSNRPANKLLAHRKCNQDRGCSYPSLFKRTHLRAAAFVRLRHVHEEGCALPLVVYVTAIWHMGVGLHANSHPEVWQSL